MTHQAERIVRDELRPEGILRTYESGRQELVDYMVDENGEEYADMFPNDKFDAEQN